MGSPASSGSQPLLHGAFSVLVVFAQLAGGAVAVVCAAGPGWPGMSRSAGFN